MVYKALYLTRIQQSTLDAQTIVESNSPRSDKSSEQAEYGRPGPLGQSGQRSCRTPQWIYWNHNTKQCLHGTSRKRRVTAVSQIGPAKLQSFSGTLS